MSWTRSETHRGSSARRGRYCRRTPEGRDAPAVAHRVVHSRRVDDSVHAVGEQFADPSTEAVAARKYVIGAEAGDEIPVLLCRISDHRQPSRRHLTIMTTAIGLTLAALAFWAAVRARLATVPAHA